MSYNRSLPPREWKKFSLARSVVTFVLVSCALLFGCLLLASCNVCIAGGNNDCPQYSGSGTSSTTPTLIVTQPAVGSKIIVPDGTTEAVHAGDCVDVPDNSHISAPVKWTHVFTTTWTRVLVSGDGTVIGAATVYVNAKICSQDG